MRSAKVMLALLALSAILAPARSHAAEQERAKSTSGTPVLITADELEYDQHLGLIVAKGHVELSQKNEILLADTVTYNQRTDTVTASGHVSFLQPDGDVIFADFMQLTDNLRDGFIKDVRLLFVDGSRMAGNTARRVGGVRTEMRRAVYSPCQLCAQDPTRPPVWQIKAERIVDDKVTKVVEYHDATMEIDGFPVFYTPYMTSPDPSVKRASGFLTPVLGSDPSNGFRFGIPYYWVIGPDKDATFLPIFTTQGGTVLDGQYRQRFGDGYLTTDGSLTFGSRSINPRAPDINATSNAVRGHIVADGVLDLTDTWRAGIDAEATTDQTYLARYHFHYPTNFLTDHIYAENFGPRSYANISAYAYQNLNTNFGIANEPIILPVATYTLTTPTDSLGGRWQFTGNALNLLSPHTGLNERRLSAGIKWQLPFNGPIGDRYRFTASLRGDGYDSNVTPLAGFPQSATKIVGRIFPQVALNWRYPLIRPGKTVTTLIEPMAAIIAAPVGGNPSGIPNEDSQSFQFDESDLFQPNRFPGLDRVDGGQRVDYGLHAGFFNPYAGSTQFLIGESYRFQKQSNFLPGSGLYRQRSDVVGHALVAPGGSFDLFYRFRLDGQNLAMRRQEIGVNGGPANLHGSLSYIATSAIPSLPSILPASQISTSVSFQLTPYWSGAVSHTQNLNNGAASIDSRLSLTYRDDCLAVTGTISRSGLSYGDVRSGTSFVLTFVFRNLGDVSVGS